MSQVSVIILNWNGKKFIRDCLDSVSSQIHPGVEVIVVDNASSDGSQEVIKEEYPLVKLIENKENLGFCRAMNQGIGESSGCFILSLNNDVVLTPTYISEVIKAASIDERIGLVSGRLLKFAKKDQKEVFDSVGVTMFKNRLAHDVGEGEVDLGQYDSIKYIFGACAAAALYKREMLEDISINGECFDEAFFAFLEDVDLSWRARLRGWECLYTPDAVAYHHRGGTAVRRSKLVEMHNYKNRYLMILKNDSISSFIKNAHRFFIVDLFKAGALLFRCPAALLGWVDIIKNFPETISKRRVIQSKRKVDQKEIESLFQKFDYMKWIRKNLFNTNLQK